MAFFSAAIALLQSREIRRAVYAAAMTSISTKASLGSRETCTVERAGGAAVK
jgi:hypothetical protein